ncbi:MAG: gamma-glutamylcyclotransferase [Saprospiraceae bacterium]|nr:gamma-glutamylcyclotransferase [Saprospiraceae bacterium]
MTNKYLFTYGTLNPEAELLNSFALPYKLVGKAFVFGKKVINSEYPAVIKSNKESGEKIFGYILEFNHQDDAFLKLDKYEEYYPGKPNNSLYLRELTHAYLTESQEKVECWIYWGNEKNPNLLKTTSSSDLRV